MNVRDDKRVVYGARCTWWDSIGAVATVGRMKLPCCPHCKGPLFELPSRTEWDKMVADYAAATLDPGYPDLIFWARGKCFPNFDALREAYARRLTE